MNKHPEFSDPNAGANGLYDSTPLCTCASFFTVRGKHKKDCPNATPMDETMKKVDKQIGNAVRRLGEEQTPRERIEGILHEYVRSYSISEAEATDEILAIVREECEGKAFLIKHHGYIDLDLDSIVKLSDITNSFR